MSLTIKKVIVAEKGEEMKGYPSLFRWITKAIETKIHKFSED